ncbi:hypothetical protein [Actinomadura nitritigenes]|uniref:HNH endonuclease n=1 Tax=Actinomadura nitritigenes TaxID=134602 RepID=UPI003D8C5FD3
MGHADLHAEDPGKQTSIDGAQDGGEAQNQSPDTARATHLTRPGSNGTAEEHWSHGSAAFPSDAKKTATIKDREPVRAEYSHKEIVKRLLADSCELCGRHGNVQVHHVSKLAELDKPGQAAPDWMRIMRSRRRKTLVVCDICHHSIHTG